MDRFEKLVLNIAAATQLDDNFRKAANEDFENFSEEDYGFIREYVLSRVNEATVRNSESPVVKLEEMHQEMIQMIESNPIYIKSKIREWALSLLKDTVDTFNEDFKTEKELNEKILKTVQDEHEGFYETLAKLTHLLTDKEEVVQTVNIGTIMYQFGEMIKQSEEVFIFDEEIKTFIEKILELIKKCKRNFNAQEIGGIIHTLQYLPDCKETRAVIDAVSNSIEHYNPPLDTQCVGMSFYGLQNMEKSPEVIRFVKIIDKIIQEESVQIDPQALSNAFFGLQNIINSEELSKIKEKLLSQARGLNPEEVETTTLLSFIQAFKIIGLKIPDQLWAKYIQYTKTYEGRAFASDWEKRIFNNIQGRFKYYYGSHNYYVDGFELDIYFRESKINIELDGPHHALNSPYQEKRDDYLSQRHNIKIIRIPYGIIENEDLIMDMLSPIIKRC
ncbi:hypothetical protein C0416_00010 [bacterium]|nr:hypothetical protein [bacterium]